MFLYSAYADDTIFFASEEDSKTEVTGTFYEFSLLSDLKLSKKECETAGISALEAVSLALCCINCISLTKKPFKTLHIHFSHNK